MSVFTLSEYWSLRLSLFNISNPKLLVVGNVIHKFDGQENQLIVADDSGKILILLPVKRDQNITGRDSREMNEEEFITFYDTHLAVLDLKIGRFHENEEDRNALAVVHPNKLSIFVVHRMNLILDNGTQCESPRINCPYEMTLCCDLKFDVPLFRAHVLSAQQETQILDSVILETLGCRVYICEGSRILGFKDLCHRNIPGPTAVSGHDKIIVSFETDMLLKGYRLSEILYAHPVLDSGREMVFPVWSVPFYEPIFQLETACVCNNNAIEAFFVAVGRRAVHLISPLGKVIYRRNLSLTPSSLCVYDKLHKMETNCLKADDSYFESIPRLSFMVTTVEGHILIFQGAQIVWSARMPWGAICIKMPRVYTARKETTKLPTIGRNTCPGLVALLSPDGILRLFYFGTNPKRTEDTKRMKPVKLGQSVEVSKLSKHHTEGEAEFEDLNKRISLFNQGGAASLLLPCGKNEHVDNVELQAKVREDSTSADEIYIIDVLINFHVTSDPIEYDQVFLTAKSCSPIVVEPDYLNFPSMDIPSKVSGNTSFKQFCSLSVSFKSSETSGVVKHILDTSVQLLLVYTEKNKRTFSVECTKFVEHIVSLPFYWFYTGQMARKAKVTGSFRLTFNLASELVAYNVRLHKLLSRLWPKDYTGSTFYIQLRDERISQTEERNDVERQGTFVLENLKKSQIRMQSDHPEYFGPVLKELLNQLSLFCKETGLTTSSNCLLQLSACKSPDISSTAKQTSTDTLFLSPTVNCFCDYLFASLCEHLEARLSLATQVAANAVQARYFRALQGYILDGIRDQVSTTVIGFDTLLEASLHQLTEGCQSAISFSQKLKDLGMMVVAITSLLLLICCECLKFDTNRPKRDALLHSLSPRRLLAIVEENESVELSRGEETLPEEESSNFVTDVGSCIGLEEYLDLAVGSILGQLTEDSEVEQRNLSTATIPDVNKLMQRILCLFREISK